MDDTDELAKRIWEYMLMHQKPKKSDIIFCLCSHDTRVAERAAELFLQGYGQYIVFSGALGRLTEGHFTESEARIFADIAIAKGVPREKIILEDKSTNTSENILFTYNLLHKLDLPMKSFVLVQKPYMERRTFATFKKRWPVSSTPVTITSPQLSFEEYASLSIPKEQVINLLVGDLQRIRKYSELGYQIEQHIPTPVQQAYEELIKRGYDQQLLS